MLHLKMALERVLKILSSKMALSLPPLVFFYSLLLIELLLNARLCNYKQGSYRPDVYWWVQTPRQVLSGPLNM